MYNKKTLYIYKCSYNTKCLQIYNILRYYDTTYDIYGAKERSPSLSSFEMLSFSNLSDVSASWPDPCPGHLEASRHLAHGLIYIALHDLLAIECPTSAWSHNAQCRSPSSGTMPKGGGNMRHSNIYNHIHTVSVTSQFSKWSCQQKQRAKN